MIESFAQTFLVVFQLLASALGTTDSPQRCGAAQWVTEPKKIASGRYGAEIKIRCDIEPQQGGDLAKLESGLLDQAKQQGTIHSGPTDEQFESMPSRYMDWSYFHKGKDFEVEVRQDVHVARDPLVRLVVDSKSTDVKATGNAQYLKQLAVRVEVQKTTDPRKDAVFVNISGEITKPWFIPEGILLSEAKKRGPGEFAKGAEKAAEDLEKSY
jgi:hypothetical protein